MMRIWEFFRQMMRLLSAIGLLLMVSTGAAGEKAPSSSGGQAVLMRLDDADIPVFVDDLMYQDLAECISGSIAYFRKLPEQTPVTYGRDRYTASHMIISLERFAQFIRTCPAPLPLSAFIRKHYRVYVFSEEKTPHPVLFTGYYLPLLNGNRSRTDRFVYPVYGRPADLVATRQSSAGEDRAVIGRNTGHQVVPYYTRREITEGGVLDKTMAPIVWVDDPVDLFFLHIQGSGSVCLPDDDLIHLQFDITNGQPYRSIGKYLIDTGRMKKEQVSMQSIRAYLKTHPEEMNEILNTNDRYVFYKAADRGAVGCYDIELTPKRSLAADRRICPPAGLVYLETQKPAYAGGKSDDPDWVDFSRFMANQDTGSAITGPGRADVFWGSGPYAEVAAGYMKHLGRLYFLVLQPERGLMAED